MLVLIAEDDYHTRLALCEVLDAEGYGVLQASDGDQAYDKYVVHRPDLLCLDVMMPRLNGYEVCRKIRRSDARTPIIFLTAKGEEVDKVVGLEIGGDDYIVKPFTIKEVIARIRAVTRRCLAPQDGQSQRADADFSIADLQIFPRQLRVRRDEQWIDVSLRDIRILQLLAERAGQVVDRMTMTQRVWHQEYLPSSRTLDQHISQLRKRIERDPGNPQIIRTVHGVGYRYDPPAE